MSALIFCCDDRRRALVRQHGTLNGIDFLEVVDHDQPVLAERQRLLRVHFVKPPSPTLTTRLQALTEGGAEAALAASIFHFGEVSLAEVKAWLAQRGLEIRI